MSNWSLPLLGFDGRDDACTEDCKPLLVRWKDGPVIGGILAQLDPQWLKAYQDDLVRREELRDSGVVFLDEWRKHD